MGGEAKAPGHFLSERSSPRPPFHPQRQGHGHSRGGPPPLVLSQVPPPSTCRSAGAALPWGPRALGPHQRRAAGLTLAHLPADGDALAFPSLRKTQLALPAPSLLRRGRRGEAGREREEEGQTDGWTEKLT